jgi:hypothetical protein
VADAIAAEIVCRAKEVGSILPELRVTESKELVMSISKTNPIPQSAPDTSVNLIVAGLVNTRIDGALRQSVFDSSCHL